MSKTNRTIRFVPFRQEDLKESWKVTFGKWAVQDGKLRHLRPASPQDAELLFAGAPGIASIGLIGSVAYALPEGGADTVRLRLDFRMEVADSLCFFLDEWGAEWRPDYGMKAVLSHRHTGAKGHAYDDQVLSPTEPRPLNTLVSIQPYATNREVL